MSTSTIHLERVLDAAGVIDVGVNLELGRRLPIRKERELQIAVSLGTLERSRIVIVRRRRVQAAAHP
jgi:hypothetical protein